MVLEEIRHNIIIGFNSCSLIKHCQVIVFYRCVWNISPCINVQESTFLKPRFHVFHHVFKGIICRVNWGITVNAHSVSTNWWSIYLLSVPDLMVNYCSVWAACLFFEKFNHFWIVNFLNFLFILIEIFSAQGRLLIS